MDTTYKSLINKVLKPGFFFLVFMIIMGCGTPRDTAESQNFEELNNLVENREFMMQFQWAQPVGGGMIDLMSNPNHIKFNENEVDIFLPYFGVRHRGGGYSSEGGIKYKGDISNLNITKNPSKNSINMKFRAQEFSETFMFDITLFENGKAHATVTSSDRSTITFQGGEVRRITEER